MLEIHGNIERNFCIECGAPFDTGSARMDHPPRCTSCKGWIRPGVVWFGEMLPQDTVRDAWAAAQRCQVFFSIGTSGEVYPAAQLPSIAREHGAYTVEINPRPSAVAHRIHECIEGASGVVLPALVDELRRLRTTA